jgi:hypothetical protein
MHEALCVNMNWIYSARSRDCCENINETFVIFFLKWGNALLPDQQVETFRRVVFCGVIIIIIIITIIVIVNNHLYAGYLQLYT